jgi:hypothetical protein
MLKKRIKKWELDRNHKESDMLYAVHIALPRESQGKKTVFVIRGRVVTLEEVQYYFRRKGVWDLRSLVNEADSTTPTTRIECHTPELSHITANVSNRPAPGSGMTTESSENLIRHSGSGIMVMPDPNQVDQVLQQSAELNKLDQLLHYGRDYYNSVFEGSHWKHRHKSFDLSSLESFYHNMAEGHWLLDDGQLSIAFERFDCAFDLIKAILDQGTLLFLPYLYHLLLPGRGIQHQDVLLKALEFISQMIHTRFPHLRPVESSLALLWKMSAEDRGQYSIRVFQFLLDRLKGVFYNDQPDESQLREAAKVLCSSAQLNPCEEPTGSNDYAKTSLAVWKLSRDAELSQSYTPFHRQPLEGSFVLHASHFALDSYQTPFHHFYCNLGGINRGTIASSTIASRSLTPSTLQELNAELPQDNILPRKRPQPRQYLGFRNRMPRTGMRQTRIQQPAERSSF